MKLRKRNSFLCALLIIVLVSPAQNYFGVPYYFCAMNGSCFNQSPYWNVRKVYDSYPQEQLEYLTYQFMNSHSDFIMIDSASNLYNCHGFAYSVFQGGDEYIIEWKGSLCSYNGTNTESYMQVSENEIQYGDIATIVNPNDYGTYSVHSSIVLNEDTLISKWGNHPLFKHYKYAPWIVNETGLGNGSNYVFYRRVINTNDRISGPGVFNGTGSYVFNHNDNSNNFSCIWSVEPAAMFQVSSGSGTTANLSYATPFVRLAPKATITFTFGYGCDNHYTAVKEIDLRIPTTTISGTAISDGFVVDTNAVVTVTGVIRANENAKTIVPVGTRLIVDGGKMTSNGNVMWGGIEVWGNKNNHQYAINGNYGQGYIELKNGAVVENALCAVALWRPGYWSTTGGIIHATDASFVNNTLAVYALCYRNYRPQNNQESDYNAQFDNCEFVVDGSYHGTKTFAKHVDLADVRGVKFRGCVFSADRSVVGIHQWCIGINAYDAGFLVDAICESSNNQPCPEQYYHQSSFTGLCAGIRASSDGEHPRSFIVRNSVFNNNDIGVHAINADFPTVILNEFSVGGEAYCQYNYGIYLKNVSSFCVEENVFTASPKATGSTYGIVVQNSYGINDIYQNHFNGLSCGNLSRGVNIGFFDRSTTLGLTYNCNTNTNNHNDFVVTQKDNIGDIQPQQGSVGLPAGNTFGASGYHFYNKGTNLIDYYYYSSEPDEMPSISKLYRVTPHGTSDINICRSHYGNDPVEKTALEKELLESEFLSAYTAYQDLKQLYESRIDGGNTAVQMADIVTASSTDMWRLRAQLLGISPYLSGEVLTATASRGDVFSDPVLFEILAANPDELKKDTLINYLENKDNPLPAHMIDLLRQIASGTTARTALVAQMGKYGHDCSLAAGDIIRSNLNDSVADLMELRNWLGNMNDIAADRMAISSYLHEGDSASAFALANMLPVIYELQGEELVDHADYIRLIQLYQVLISSNRTVYQMTDAEKELVGEIADNGTGFSRSMAESLMERITGDTGDECVVSEIPDKQQRNDGGTHGTDCPMMDEISGFAVGVLPNPATTWTMVEYNLPANNAKALLEVTSSLGVKVLLMELKGSQGQEMLDLRGLSGGVYSYSVRCGEHVKTGKIVITK